MDFLLYEFLSKPLWMWLGFLTIVVVLMIFDLGVLNKGDDEIGVVDSLKLSAFYIMIAIAFGGYIWWAWSNGTLVTTDGTNPVASYFQGYLIEKVLSIDNVFDRTYYETVDSYTSALKGQDPVERFHVTPGYPITFVGGISIRLFNKDR